jgi:hypothetical protein
VHCAYPVTVRATIEQDRGETIGSINLPDDWEAYVLERLKKRHSQQDKWAATRAELYALGDLTRQK